MSSPPDSNLPEVRSRLVPPSQRRQFILKYTLLTILGWLLGNLLSTLVRTVLFGSQGSVLFSYGRTGGLLGTYIAGAILGAVLGTAQWFILRRYRVSYAWILATGAGWLISATIAQIWSQRIGGLLSSFAYLWLGLAQWAILRKWVKPSWWWVFVPPVAILLSGLCRLIILLIALGVNQGLPLIWGLLMEIIVGAVLGIVQAAGFCWFQQRSSHPSSLAEVEAIED